MSDAELKPNLQSRTARTAANVYPRKKPYKARLQPGLHLGYRRPVYGPGEWSVIMAKGDGTQGTRGIGTADDPGLTANGVTVLTYAQAAAKARVEALKIASGVDVAMDPPTIDAVLLAYKDHLRARGRAPHNADMPRPHLKGLLTARSDQVQSGQLKRWRDGLIAKGMKRSTCNRMVKPLIAALNEAAKHDTRIAANAKAWTVGLAKLDEGNTARNAILSNEQVRAVVAAAHEISHAFGIFVQMHAETGNRSSQIARLTVGDLQRTVHGYRVIMPPSYKGDGGHKRPVPIPLSDGLAEHLSKIKRPDDALLLVRADGRAWRKSDQRYPFEQARKAAGLPEGATIYWLRHSSIVRALGKGIPIKVVADVHSTGVAQIEKHYAAHMRNHHDDIVRKTLVDFTPQVPQSNAA